MTGTPRHRITEPSVRSLHRTLLLALLMLAVLPLAVPTCVLAQEEVDETRKDIDTPGLMIEAAAGWDSTLGQGSGIPIALLITNQSGEIIRGEVILHDPLYGNEVSLGEVVIAPNTSRRLSTIQAMSNWYECLAEFRSGGDVLWRRDLPLNTGKDFFANISYALFVDDGGRNLQLPGAIVDSTSVGSNSMQIAPTAGRPVQCLTAKTWQVPNHHGPMIPVQAMIFREGAKDKTLNKIQWKAVAEWMCHGGIVFVHEKSEELVAALAKASPLKSKAIETSADGTFSIRRIGLGAIYEYSQPLFTPEGNATRKQIAQTVSQLPKHHLTTLVSTGFLHNPRGGRADRNRFLIVGFFLLYAFLSGVVSIMLFRLTQRRIAIYTLIVVSGACVLSAVLGGLLRFSEGDLNWMTVTQAGPGGAVQVARIEIQSSGGRSTQVAVKGHHPDLQFTGRAHRRYYYWNQEQTGIGPFTWQRNQATGEGAEDAYQIDVPMTPWGSRRLYGSAFKPNLPRLGFKIEFAKSAQPPQPPTQPPTMPGDLGVDSAETGLTEEPTIPPAVVAAPGTATVTLVNHLPYDLVDLWLVVGVSPQAAAPVAGPVPIPVQPGQPIRRGPQMTIGVVQPANVPTDLYQMKHIPDLAAGASHKEIFGVAFQQFRNAWDLHRAWEHGQITLPRVSRFGTASAWIVGRLKTSPILSIDRKRCDFFPHEGLHLYVQEILPEDIPAAAEFFPPPPAPNPAANGAGQNPGEPDGENADENSPAESSPGEAAGEPTPGPIPDNPQ